MECHCVLQIDLEKLMLPSKTEGEGRLELEGDGRWKEKQ